jgi:hypothetical protein
MLPCNVVVAAEEDERTRVEVFDPAITSSLNSALADVASEARERLSAMMAALTADVEETDAARA